jgi:hypothetical protein
MTVAERLAGCPTGATRHALRLFHSDIEINEAVLSGLVRREVREYANPRGMKIEWLTLKSNQSSGMQA